MRRPRERDERCYLAVIPSTSCGFGYGVGFEGGGGGGGNGIPTGVSLVARLFMVVGTIVIVTALAPKVEPKKSQNDIVTKTHLLCPIRKPNNLFTPP